MRLTKNKRGLREMFQLDYGSRIPIYEQLFNNVISLVAAGVLRPGDKLPAVRLLADELGINPNTVAKAYRALENEGYIYTMVGRGTFVADKLSQVEGKKLDALEKFKKAAYEAVSLGATAEELNDLVQQVVQGGILVDRDKEGF